MSDNKEDESDESSFEDLENLDLGDEDDLANDLALLAAVEVDQYVKRVDASESVTMQMQRHFAFSENTTVTEGVCAIRGCEQDTRTKSCQASTVGMPPLKLYWTDCTGCDKVVKQVSSGGVNSKGLRVEVKVLEPDDLERDIHKSATATVEIPELGLELGSGTLGWRYCTIADLMNQIQADLTSSTAMMMGEEKSDQDQKIAGFLKSFGEYARVDKPFTLIIDDPLGKVFVSNPVHPEPDPKLSIRSYEDLSTLPPHNKPQGYEATEEWLAAEAKGLGCVVKEASFAMKDNATRALYLTRNVKQFELIGPMYGDFSTENITTNRIVSLKKLSFRFRNGIFMDGGEYCAVTFINDPTYGEAKGKGTKANAMLKEDETKEANDPLYLGVYAMRDIEASPEHPVEVWMEYNADRNEQERAQN